MRNALNSRRHRLGARPLLSVNDRGASWVEPTHEPAHKPDAGLGEVEALEAFVRAQRAKEVSRAAPLEWAARTDGPRATPLAEFPGFARDLSDHQEAYPSSGRSPARAPWLTSDDRRGHPPALDAANTAFEDWIEALEEMGRGENLDHVEAALAYLQRDAGREVRSVEDIEKIDRLAKLLRDQLRQARKDLDRCRRRIACSMNALVAQSGIELTEADGVRVTGLISVTEQIMQRSSLERIECLSSQVELVQSLTARTLAKLDASNSVAMADGIGLFLIPAAEGASSRTSGRAINIRDDEPERSAREVKPHPTVRSTAGSWMRRWSGRIAVSLAAAATFGIGLAVIIGRPDALPTPAGPDVHEVPRGSTPAARVVAADAKERARPQAGTSPRTDEARPAQEAGDPAGASSNADRSPAQTGSVTSKPTDPLDRTSPAPRGPDIAGASPAPLSPALGAADSGSAPAKALTHSSSSGLGTLPLSASSPAGTLPTFNLAGIAAPAALLRAVGAGQPEASYALAMRLADRPDKISSIGLVTSLLEHAASAGLAPAQHRLGERLERGQGVERNVIQAKLWYQRAAEKGNVRAMYDLAVLLTRGEPNYSQAAEWFRRAALHGNKDGAFNLAVILARGLGVRQDLPSAHAWFAWAARAGDPDAAQKRDNLAMRMTSSALASARKTEEQIRVTVPNARANDVEHAPDWS